MYDSDHSDIHARAAAAAAAAAPHRREYSLPRRGYTSPPKTAGFESIREALAALRADLHAGTGANSLPTYLHRPPGSLFQRSASSCGGVGQFTASQGCSIRKAFSTGDIQRINYLQQSHGLESSASKHEHCGMEHGVKVGRYSAEERRERIERYRSKRNQRNFSKKIKYACRKTLADSRPRVRGRFARNDEMGDSSGMQWASAGGVLEEEEEDEEGWVNFLDAFSMSLIP